jgi:Tfp pilus assembly protein FimV
MADYTAKKGDSLWSIAEANKPAGVSTGEYWNKLKAANSGVKLFSGTKVALPAFARTTATTRNADVAEKLAQRDMLKGQKDATERGVQKPGSHFRKPDARPADATERGVQKPGSHYRKPDVKMDAVERGSRTGSHFRKPDVKMDAVERGSRTGSHFRQKDK